MNKEKIILKWAEIIQEQVQNGASLSDIVQFLEDFKSEILKLSSDETKSN